MQELDQHFAQLDNVTDSAVTARQFKRQVHQINRLHGSNA